MTAKGTRYLFAALLFAVFSGHAGATGFTGKVTMEDGTTVLSGVPVQIVNPAGDAIITSANTDGSGDYSLTSLSPGTYHIQVSTTGYFPVIYSSYTVGSGQDIVLNFALQASGEVYRDDFSVTAGWSGSYSRLSANGNVMKFGSAISNTSYHALLKNLPQAYDKAVYPYVTIRNREVLYSGGIQSVDITFDYDYGWERRLVFASGYQQFPWQDKTYAIPAWGGAYILDKLLLINDAADLDGSIDVDHFLDHLIIHSADRGYVGGLVTDRHAAPLANARVEFLKNGVKVGEALTDTSGGYSIWGTTSASVYTVQVSTLGTVFSQGGLAIAGRTQTTANFVTDPTQAGCGLALNVAKSGETYTGIQAAVNTLSSLSTTTCVIIRDTATYSEQVTVAGITNNGHRLKIMADPTFTSSAPVVTPPEYSTAAFMLLNDSVTLQGINILSTNSVTYGVYSSSAFVSLSSVNVVADGTISQAGIYISSNTSLSYSSVTVTDANGLELVGSNSYISFSTFTNDSGSLAALSLSGADSSTVTASYIHSGSGRALFLREGSDNNRIEYSTMTGQATVPTLYITDSDSNTVTHSYLRNSAGYGIVIETLSEFNAVEYSTVTGGSIYMLARISSSSNTFRHLFMENTNGPGVFMEQSGKFDISDSTVIGRTSSASVAAFTMQGSSNITITDSYLHNSLGMGVYSYAGSDNNNISYSTITGSGGTSGGLHVAGSFHTYVTGSYLGNSAGAGAYLGDGSAYNRISSSTIEGLGGYPALWLNGAISNEITRSTVNALTYYALEMDASSDNRISYSTLTSGGGGFAAFYASSSDSNTITASYLSAPAGYGAYLSAGSDNNLIEVSELYAGGGRSAVFLQNSASNTITGSYLNDLDTYAADIYTGASNTRIAFSTLTAAGADGAVRIYSSSHTVLDGLYVQGSTAVFVNRSTNTIIGGSVFRGTDSLGYALRLAGSSVDLALSSSTLTGGAEGAALYLDGYNSGSINISSNTFNGGKYGVHIGTLSAGSGLVVTSNTILPAIDFFYDTYGLYLGGLPSGATIYNNNIYFRAPGIATGHKVYALYGRGVNGLNFMHNRINNPGMVSGGEFVAVSFTGSRKVNFNFNDVKSSGSASFLLLESITSTFTLKNNIFVASGTAGVWLLYDNLNGALVSDFNCWADFGNGLSFEYMTNSYADLTAYNGATGLDAASLETDPLWNNTSAGVEDFHPQSAQGRWQDGLWVNDAETSPTVNTGDPGEPYTAETMPDGLRVNMGSYGNTAEASRADPPGAVCGAGDYCSLQCDVNQAAGPFQTIQHALDTATHDLAEDLCVVIHDLGPYQEQVTVENYTNDNSNRVIIMAVPTFASSAPVISPPAASTAAFRILADSVTVQGINIAPMNSVTYGILSSSAALRISSVNVISGGLITGAGVEISSYSLVEYSSITAQAGHGLKITGAGSSVAFSTMTSNSSSKYGLYLWLADSATVTGSYISNASGTGAGIMSGSDHASISNSTIAAGGSYTGLFINAARYSRITGVHVSVTNGSGLKMSVGANFNTVVNSTITSNTLALEIFRSSANAVYSSYLRSSTAAYVNGSTGTVIGGSELFSTNVSGHALRIAESVGLSLATSTLSGGASGAAVFLAGDNSGAIMLSSNIITGGRYGLNIDTQTTGAALSISSLTFRTLSSGATAINFLGGQFVSTFSGVAFNSADLAVNVNASALTSGSDIRMLQHAGLRSASLYVNDPQGYVNWQLPEGCGYGIGVSKDGTSNFLTIQEAVDAAPASLSTNTCVVVRDAQTYSEQVTLGDFNTNGFRFMIMADPSLGSAPVVNPPEFSTAAFRILNDSVTVQGINIVSTNTVPYGIKVSSSLVNISSVVVDGGSSVFEAGVFIAGYGSVAYSSVSVHGAHSLWLQGKFNSVTMSTITNAAGGYYALYADGISSSTVSDSYIYNPSGYGAYFDSGANNNEVLRSTISIRSSPQFALYFNNAVSSNTVSGSYIFNQAGHGVGLGPTARYNTINQSTIAVVASGKYALFLMGASGNNLDQNHVSSLGGHGVFVADGASGNTLSRSTVTSGAGGFYAVYFSAASSNTIVDSYVQGSTAAYVYGSTGTVIGGSVFVAANTAGQALRLAGGSLNLQLATSTFSGGQQGSAVYLDRDNSGAITLSSNVITGGQYGLNIASQTPGAVLTITSITFQSLSSGATAINFLDGTFVSTITAAGFRASGISVNVNASALEAGSSLTMDQPGGQRGGMLFENDPAGYVTWPPFAPGCGAGLNIAKDGSGHYTGIMDAIAAMPVNLSTDTCVIIRDTETYSEQVTVQGFNNNGYRFKIMADPAFISSAPVVTPPEGAAAGFRLLNDSVTVQGINIVSTNTVGYGIFASSASARISSVTVDAVRGGMGYVTAAGIYVFSSSLVEYSSISVLAASGLSIGGPDCSVYFSTMNNSVAGASSALYIAGVASATVAGVYARNTNGHALSLNYSYNARISSSVLTGDLGNYSSLYLIGASTNTVERSYISNTDGAAAVLTLGSDNNTISYSTFTGKGWNYSALQVYESSRNRITDSYFFNPEGDALRLYNYSGMNSVENSVLDSTAPAYSALSMWAADSNTITGSYLRNPYGYGARVYLGSDFNKIYFSTLTSSDYHGLYIHTSATNTIGDCYISGSTAAYILASAGSILNSSVFVATNTAGNGLRLAGNSANLSVSSSTLAGGPQGAGILIESGNLGLLAISSNIITGGQYGLNIAAQGAGAELSVDSITFASLSAGATAVNFTGGVLVATFTRVAFNSPEMTVNINASVLQEGSSVYIRLPAGQKAGQDLANDTQRRVRWPWVETATVNAVSSFSVTVGFAENGADGYEVQAADSANFLGPASSSSVSGLPFPALEPRGLLADTTSYLRAGARWDQSVYYDPALVLSTSTLAEPPLNTAVQTVYLASAAVSWDMVTSQGYVLEASTAADFTGTVSSSSSAGLQVSWLPVENLLSNTTYYFRAASLNWNGLPSYAAAVSSATLPDPVTGADVTGVFQSSVAVSWTPLPAAPPAPSSAACEGYSLQASTDPAFSGQLFSASTADPLASSLALSGMESDIMYYFRAGALNWNGVPNYVLAGSTITPDITPPSISTGVAAYQSSVPNGILVAWTTSGDNGYAGHLAAGSQFRVQWTTSAPEAVTWSTTAAQVVIATGPVEQGIVVSTAIFGLESGKTAYVRVWTSDEKGQWSVMSATASAFISPFSFETVDGAVADVGVQPSVAADAAGNLHVSYGETVTNKLKYAFWNGAWTISPSVSDVEGALHSSLALDGGGQPHASYLRGNPDYDLGYASFTGTGWGNTIVDADGITGLGTSIKLDGLGNPRISYLDISNNMLRYASWSGSAWSSEDVDGVGDASIASAVLELAADGTPHIAYSETTGSALKYATRSGGAWATITLASVASGDRNISLVLGSSANAHIAYVDPAGVLKYAQWNGGLQLTDIDGGVVASQTSIALDGAGWPHISYYDQTGRALKYAKFDGVVWSTYTVDSYGDAGSGTSIALDGTGNVHIVYRAADDSDLRAAHWTGAGLAAPLGGNARGRVQAPGNMATGLLGSTSIQWHWTDNAANEEGYALYYSSTGAAPYVFGSSAAALSPLGQEGTWFQEGLTPNTSYQAYAAAYGAGGVVLSSPALVYTLAEAPQSLAATGIHASSFTYSWSGGANPDWTNYQAQLSTAADFTGDVPGSSTNAEFVAIEGLTGNTSYYLRVIAFNNAGLPAVSTAPSSMLTKPALPSPSGFSNVLSSSFTVSWSTSANSPETQYYAQAGTDPGFSVGAYVTTYASSHTFTGLSANSTYYVRIKAIGLQGDETAYVQFGSTITTAVMPSTTVACAVSSVAVTGYWSYNGNAYGTRYLAQVSTDNFSTVLASSETLGDHAQFLAGISPDTTHYLRVASLNSRGALSPFAVLPEALTLAAPPVKQADTFPLVGSFAVTLQWLGNPNPTWTEYAAEVSTAADFSVSAMVAPGWAASVSAAATGLDPLTVYYFRARARNAAGIVTAYENLGSTMTLFGVDTSSPVIANGQSGDAVWRSSNTKTYNIDLSDAGGSFLDRLEIRASSGPGGSGTQAFGWSGTVTGINSNSYTADWGLTSTQWGLLAPGTNYISVRAYDNNGNYSEALGAFYIQKDTSAPVITDGQAGETSWRGADPGPVYLVDFADEVSGLASVEYSASNTPGSANGNVLDWTALPGLTPGATSYNGPWAVAFGALFSGVTNYISVRARDVTGTLAQKTDAFNVLKNTGGPAVTIASPYAGHYSSFTTIAGSAVQVLGYAITGTELTLQDRANYNYWNGSGWGVSQVWLKASGTTAWSYDVSAVLWASCTSYQVVARSSDTALNYSAPYATATFTFDSSLPVAFISTPAAGAVLETPALVSGTAQDPSPDSAVPYISLTLRRASDLKWWNFFTGAWVDAAISTVTAGGAAWAYYPDGALRGNLQHGASYYIYAVARDGALPANESPAGLYATTFTVTDTVPPGAVTAVAGVTNRLPGKLDLFWTASGDDGAAALLASGYYAVACSTDPGAVLSTQTLYTYISTGSVSPGSSQAYTLADLTPGVTYYLKIWARDEAENWSSPSALVTALSGRRIADAISGNVRTALRAGITGVLVEAINRDLAVVQSAYTADDGSGSFTLGGLAVGIYRVQATWLDNGFASSVSADQIPAGYSEVDFELSLDYELASIGGELPAYRESSSSSFRGRSSAPQVRLYQRGRLVATAAVGAGGRFLIKNLLPGDYTLDVPDTGGGRRQVAVTLRPGENLRVSSLGEILRADKIYAYPNPAGRSVTFHLESDYTVLTKQVVVFDITGREIKEFKDAEFVTVTGGWEVRWEIPPGVASGVYLYAVRVKSDADGGKKKTVKKFAIVR